MSDRTEDTDSGLQAQLAELRAQVEHWQGVATICELSKQEELTELQKHCDEEIQSLQEALRETAAQYEARISVLQSQPVEWKRSSGHGLVSVRRAKMDADSSSLSNSLTEGDGSRDRRPSQTHSPDLDPSGDGEASSTDGYFALRHEDSESLSSFSLDTPSLPRKRHEDTDSLVSTGTLVPEAIYLPPPGHRLVTHSDWDALNAQVSELRREVSRLQEEKEELETELEVQTNHTHTQVTLLQCEVKNSESLLQDLQKSFSQSQHAVQSRLAELSFSQRKMCNDLSRLKGNEVEDEDDPDSTNTFTASLQGAHCEERLRIEIVNLREQLNAQVEENEVLDVQLSSLKVETERIQTQKDHLQAEVSSCRTELDALRVALSHVQNTNKTLTREKATLHQQTLELRSQVISLRSQVDTSQTVQRDFVQLSQSLQVKLEVIRQAETLEQVKEILEDGRGEVDPSPADAS